MKDVEEVYIDEISIIELVSFLVKEIYSNFPEIMELYDNIDEIRGSLYNNIKAIKRIPKDVDYGESANYDALNKEIKLFYKDKISLKKIKEDNNLKNTIVYESIRALLNRTEGKQETGSGCATNNKSNKKIIRGIFSERFKFFGEKNIFKRMLVKQKFLKKVANEQLGYGLNDGFTVWLTEKIIGIKARKEVYPLERSYVDSIADLIGDKEALKIATGDYVEMASMFNMSLKDLYFFLKCIDMASETLEQINECGNFENPDQITKDYINDFVLFQRCAQNVFIKNFVIPTYDKKISENGITIDILDSICRISNRFEWTSTVSKFGDDDEKTQVEDSYKLLEKYKIFQFIEFSNTACIDNYSDIEILGIEYMFDYVFKDCSDEVKNLIDSKFYSNLKSKATIIKQKNIKIHIGGKGIGHKMNPDVLIGDLLRNKEISESEFMRNRATRRAAKRERKKGESTRMK